MDAEGNYNSKSVRILMWISQDRLGYTVATNNLHISVVPKDSVLLTPHVCFELAASVLHIFTQGPRLKWLSFPPWTLLVVVAEACTGFSSWSHRYHFTHFVNQSRSPWACLSSTGIVNIIIPWEGQWILMNRNIIYDIIPLQSNFSTLRLQVLEENLGEQGIG